MNCAVLGLGSNLGRKSANLCEALMLISGFCGIERVSSVYKTASLLNDDQDSYFNICTLVSTHMPPSELLSCLKHAEKKMGRTNTGRWYSRVIDIDIIDFNNVSYISDNLTIPHPQMHHRIFVLQPMMEILPSYIHPVSCLSIENMVKMIKDDLGIKKTGELLWR